MAAAKKKTAAKKAAAKKTSGKKPAAKKTTAKKSATKKAAAKKAAPKKTAAKKTAAKKPATKKVAAKKAAPKKTAGKKTAAKKTATKQAAAKPAAAKKSTAKKAAPAKKSAAATKAAPKKSTPKKSASKSSVSTSRTSASSTRSSLLSNDQPDVVEIPKPRGTTKDGIAYTKDFDVKFLKAQRDELEARRASELRRATRLEDEAESLVENGEMGDVQFDDEGGEGDTMVVQRDLDRVLSSQARAAIEEIDAALQRIAEGTYGYSVVSGQPIPRERLEALPETTMLATEKVSGIGGR